MSELIKADKQYYENPAISQSGLKCFMESPVEFYNSFVIRNLEVYDSPAFRFGRFYHTYILEPEKVDLKYVYNDVKINDNLKSLYSDYYKLKDFDKAFERSGYSIKNKDNYKNKIEEDNDVKAYLKLLSETEDKDIIDLEDLSRCKQMKLILVSEPILQKSLFKTNYDIDDYNEYEIYLTLNSIPIKAKIDKIKISHRTKRILIFDLKTTSCKNLEDFKISMIKYGYHIQDAFYVNIVREHFKTEYPDYTIDFVFVPQKSSLPYQFLGLLRISEECRNKVFNDTIIPTLDKMAECYKTGIFREDYLNKITVFDNLEDFL